MLYRASNTSVVSVRGFLLAPVWRPSTTEVWAEASTAREMCVAISSSVLVEVISLCPMPTRVEHMALYFWGDGLCVRPEVLFVHHAILRDKKRHHP